MTKLCKTTQYFTEQTKPTQNKTMQNQSKQKNTMQISTKRSKKQTANSGSPFPLSTNVLITRRVVAQICTNATPGHIDPDIPASHEAQWPLVVAAVRNLHNLHIMPLAANNKMGTCRSNQTKTAANQQIVCFVCAFCFCLAANQYQ